ncbi:F-box domain containing protein [Tanacetum coccineum]
MSTSLQPDDLISKMPDEILVTVLSMLPINNAAATTVLSPRWRYLWSQLDQLNFDGSQTLCNIHSSLWDSERNKFIKNVNNVIEKKRDCRIIQDFRIRFALNNRVRGIVDSVNKWLTFVVDKQVEFLELSFMDRDDSISSDELNCVFPQSFFESNLFKRPSMIDGVSKTHLFLKKLVLRKVCVTESILEKILKFCPHLETLIIHHGRYLKHINVGGRHLKLKHFEIAAIRTVSSILLTDFDLESFTYRGSEIVLDIDRVPKLKEIDMYDGRLAKNLFKPIQSCAFSLELLSINIKDPQKSLEIHSLPELPNVKKLRLAISGSKYDCLQYLAAILNACPNLENFTIKPLGSPVIKPNKRKATCNDNCYKHLKFCKIVGYYGRNCDFELAEYILESAVALKRIVIDAQPTTYSMSREVARSTTEHSIRSILPPSVELVIV